MRRDISINDRNEGIIGWFGEIQTSIKGSMSLEMTNHGDSYPVYWVGLCSAFLYYCVAVYVMLS